MNSKPEFITYVEDFIYGTKWRWKWEKEEVTNIQCYCPKCDAILVYDDRSSHTKYTDVSKTDFICQNCDSQIVTSIHGGNKNYALSAVKREIERRIRTNEYKTTLEKN
jgi:RNase P subunit RPR2